MKIRFRTGSLISVLSVFAGVVWHGPLTAEAYQFGDFGYTTNNNQVTITNYTGPGGAVNFPSAILVGAIELPVTAIADYVFYANTTVTQAELPSSLTNIGTATFYLCTNLVSVAFPQALVGIGESAFEMCYNLTSITLPAGVTSLGTGAFDDCVRLYRVVLPTGITTVPSFAFAYCSSLTNVVIPNAVTNVGMFAFGYCPNLTRVLFTGDAPTLGMNPFDSTTTVYYLPGTTGWTSTLGNAPTTLWNPLAEAPGVRSNRFSFTVTGTANIPVVVEATTNLANNSWVPLQSSTITNGSVYFSDPAWKSYWLRWYRIRWP